MIFSLTFYKRYLFGLSTLFLLFGVISLALAQTSTVSETSQTLSQEDHPYKSEMLMDDGRTAGDFVVGPGKVELSLEPGESQTVELLVTNRTGAERVFSIDFEDMTGGGTADQAVILLGEDKGPYTLRDYLSVPQEKFVLKNLERVSVPVTVTLPLDTEPGSRYGSVLFSITSQTLEEGNVGSTKSSSAIISRIGTLFFVTSKGDIKKEGALVDFSTKNDKFWFSRGPIPLRVVYENTGSQHLNPYGYVSIKNLFGEEIGYMEVDPWFVLPQAIRVRDIDFPREFLLGYYTAELHMNRGYDDVVDSRSISFLVVPWRVIIIVFSGLIVVLLLLRLGFSRFEIKRK